jgi:hypothetical protein
MSALETAPAVHGVEEQCWCCGAPARPAVRLGNHPEVAICLRCAHWLRNQAQEIEDASRSGPAVTWRNLARSVRTRVMRRGWHRRRWVGRPLRWLGRRMP